MAKFRKKPVVIEAIQWDNTTETFDKIKVLEGKVKDPYKMIVWHTCHDCLSIPTLEGNMKANIGDWIIKGVKNEFYPCKPDIFEQTYEPVDNPKQKCKACGGSGYRLIGAEQLKEKCPHCNGTGIEPEIK